MFYLHFKHFYAFSGTNLLTRCHNASCQFSAVFGFRKVIKEIFLEMDETKIQSPIFPNMFTKSKDESKEGTEAPSPCGDMAPLPACRHVVRRPRASTDVALSPINIFFLENPRYPIKNPRKVPSLLPSSTLDQEGSEALPDILRRGDHHRRALYHHAYLRSDA